MTSKSFLLLGSLAAASLAAAQPARPVETGTYLTGAWHTPNTEAARTLYRKAGFNLIGYSGAYADWAAREGMSFISWVDAWGQPGGTAEAFEAHDGTRSGSVGLFTAFNFNAPAAIAWWHQSVPQQVRRVQHADRTAFWKVHNEFGYHAGKYWDYSSGSIAKYRRWLDQRYGGLAALNAAWHTRYEAFDQISPPRQPAEAEVANWLEWRRFTCWKFGEYFRTTGDSIRKVLPGAQVSDNLYPVNPMQGWDPFELARQTDYIAYDIYAIGHWDELLNQLDLGRSAGRAYGKPFLMMEYHAGPNQNVREVTAEDLWIEANVALARECRALQWYMFSPATGGREQGIHGILDSQGRPTERLTAVRQVSERTQRLAPLLKGTIEPSVAVLWSADNAYLAEVERSNWWAQTAQLQTLGRLLGEARIPFELIDPVWLEQHGTGRYRCVLVPHVPVLSDAQLAALRKGAEGGCTVIFFPDSGRRDGLGGRRAQPLFSGEAKPGRLWSQRPVNGGDLAVETVGRGRLVRCGWELPQRPGEAALRRERAQAVADLLARQAQVKPAVLLSGDADPATLDAVPLRTAGGTMLFLTALGHEPRGPVTVTVPGRPYARDQVYALDYRSAAVQRLAARHEAGGTTFTVPRIDPAVIVFMPANWQPLVGVEAPSRMVAGGRYRVMVTVDNLGAETVAGRVALEVPAGWTATCAQPDLAALAPGARAEVPFDLTVPAGAAEDRFGIDYPLNARLTLSAGRSGTVAATMLPQVVPPLDVLLSYQERPLNPWQEMTPAIMRWGWESEVHTPPPPPVSIQAPTAVEATVIADPSLAGREAAWRLEPDGQVTPARSQLAAGRQTIALQVTVPRAGSYRLVGQAGAVSFTAPFLAGVNRETVAAALAGEAKVPAGCTPRLKLSVGTRGAPARGTPVTFVVDLPPAEVARARVFDDQGHLVPAAVGPKRVVLAADVPADAVRLYTLALAAPTAPSAASSVQQSTSADGGLTVGGDRWAITFDSRLGLVRSLQVGDGPLLAPHRTGVVAMVGGAEWAPDGRGLVSDLATSASAVQAQVAFQRRIGPQDELAVRETWTIEAQRAAVALRIENVARQAIALTRLSYELGLSPDVAGTWRMVQANGRLTRGDLPTGFGAAGSVSLIDWLTADGRGLGLTLGRCALASKWQSGFTGVSHSAAATRLGLLGGAQLDPGDYVIAEFTLWPHRQELTAAQAAVPELVTAVR